ncbi:MAG: hypothetical protein ACLU5K_02090 [Christensenellales bacterium]
MDKKWPAWIVLGLIALIAGCALGLTNEVTAPVIKEQALQAKEARCRPPRCYDFEELAVIMRHHYAMGT